MAPSTSRKLSERGDLVLRALAPVGVTRAAFVTWFAANNSTLAVGTVVDCDGLSYRYTGSGSAIGDLPGWVPNGSTMTAQHWGAAGDYNRTTQGGTDDTAAFLAMEVYSRTTAGGAMEILVTAFHKTTAPIIFSGFGVRVRFVSSLAGIYGDHTTGPIFQFKKGFSSCIGGTFGATTARAAAAFSMLAAGVIVGDFDWTNTAVGAGASPRGVKISQSTILDQPGDGIFLLGQGVETAQNLITACKGMGIRADTGEVLGLVPTVIGFPAWSKLLMNQISGCGGNGIAIGSPTSMAAAVYSPYRWVVENNDVGLNATDAAVRYSTQQYWMSCDGLQTFANVSAGTGMFVHGRSHDHRNNRFTGQTSDLYVIGAVSTYLSTGIVIDQFRNDVPVSSANPAISIDALMTLDRGVYVRQGSTLGITNLVASADLTKYAEVIFSTSAWNCGVSIGPASSGTFTPTIAPATPGDVSIAYTTQTGKWERIGDKVHISIQLIFAPTYTTASGVWVISGYDGPAWTNGLNQSVPFSNLGKFSFTGAFQVRTNGTNTLRLTQTISGALNSDITTAHLASGAGLTTISIDGTVFLT